MLLVGPATEVYEGMIIGENARDEEMDVNPTRGRSRRTSGPAGRRGGPAHAAPVELSLEQALEFIAEDECVEVTPKPVRLRKVVLDPATRAPGPEAGPGPAAENLREPSAPTGTRRHAEHLGGHAEDPGGHTEDLGAADLTSQSGVSSLAMAVAARRAAGGARPTTPERAASEAGRRRRTPRPPPRAIEVEGGHERHGDAEQPDTRRANSTPDVPGSSTSISKASHWQSPIRGIASSADATQVLRNPARSRTRVMNVAIEGSSSTTSTRPRARDLVGRPGAGSPDGRGAERGGDSAGTSVARVERAIQDVGRRFERVAAELESCSRRRQCSRRQRSRRSQRATCRYR